ncbi:MAG TPA: hypothetical protein VLM85_05490 [Polyangiaceae bacterium]|nr:hypothetical protein [Polyangiaceae bacterium]
MRKILLPVAAAAAFGLAPYATKLGATAGSAWLVLLGVLLAIGASGSLDALAIASGALAAFGGHILGSVLPAAGGAVLVGLAYAERTSRVRGTQARLVHVGATIAVGALAGSLAAAYAAASPAVRGVAVLVSAVLVALPLLVDADDPLAHALEAASKRVSDPARASLRDGAELRRQVHDVPVDPASEKSVRATWRALRKLSEVRIRLERSKGRAGDTASPARGVVDMVDKRIADHVAVLARAYTAADTARAAAVGLDDAALKTVENASEALEDVTRAMEDVKRVGA